MKNKIQIVTDGEDPLLLRFFLDGAECLNDTFLETRLASDIWIPCHFLYDEQINYEGLNIKTPRVLIWLESHIYLDYLPDVPSRIAAKIVGNPLDGFYRWPTPNNGAKA